ncbi:MAG TPA: hypothetical protein VGN14_08900 [Candidatus Elarobacter sp.]
MAAVALIVIPSAPTDALGYPCGTPGKDGSPSLGGVPNTYWAGSGTASGGATSITLGTRNPNGSVALATTGDMLLLIQMQGATISTTNSAAYGDGSTGAGWTGIPIAGRYEFVTVRSAPAGGADTGNTISVVSAAGGGLINTYVSAVATATQGQETWQIVRVPQYLNFTASAPLYTAKWNGSSGGVISLDVAKNLTMPSGINADGYGFRGGGQNVWGNGGPTNTPPASWSANKGAVTDYVYPITPATQTLAGFTYTSGSTYDGGPDGFKGEGIAGTPAYTYASGDAAAVKGATWGYPGGDKARGAPGNAGGGATDSNVNGTHESPNANTWNPGGGGGGNGGAGGLGGKNWDGNGTDNGASAITSGEGHGGKAWAASATSIVMGGGGGAGANNDGSAGTRVITVGGGGTFTPTATTASSGASGGGIVILRVGGVTSGVITAKGISAPDPDYDGGGGGGAGGTVVLVGTGAITATINVSGGAGACSTGGCGGNSSTYPTYKHGTGGGGGGGVVINSGTSVTATLTGGAAGQTAYNGTPANDTYGALAGGNGVQITGVAPSSIPGVRSGAECALLLLAKRVTAFNGTARTTYASDGFTDPNSGQVIDANVNWPWSCSPAWSCGGNPQLLGTLTETPKTNDTVEYTIYFLSSGGLPVQFTGAGAAAQGVCDFVPPNTTIVPTQYVGKPMSVTLGYSAPATTNYGQVAAVGQTGYYAIVGGVGNPVALPTICGAVPAGSTGAVFFTTASLPSYPTADGGFGKLRFTVKQN